MDPDKGEHDRHMQDAFVGMPRWQTTLQINDTLTSLFHWPATTDHHLQQQHAAEVPRPQQASSSFWAAIRNGTIPHVIPGGFFEKHMISVFTIITFGCTMC